MFILFEESWIYAANTCQCSLGDLYAAKHPNVVRVYSDMWWIHQSTAKEKDYSTIQYTITYIYIYTYVHIQIYENFLGKGINKIICHHVFTSCRSAAGLHALRHYLSEMAREVRRTPEMPRQGAVPSVWPKPEHFPSEKSWNWWSFTSFRAFPQVSPVGFLRWQKEGRNWIRSRTDAIQGHNFPRRSVNFQWTHNVLKPGCNWPLGNCVQRRCFYGRRTNCDLCHFVWITASSVLFHVWYIMYK